MVDRKAARFFDSPTQVAFFDPDSEKYLGGIAYGERLICLECGGVIEIDNYLDEVEEVCPTVTFPIVPLKWCDLSEACLGDLQLNPPISEAALP